MGTSNTSTYTYTDIETLPLLPLYQGKKNAHNAFDLLTYFPPLGYEYGFSQTGLRLDNDIYKNVNCWDIHKLAMLVDVITWLNVNNSESTEAYGRLTDEIKQRELMKRFSCINLTDYGNMAYIVLNSNDKDTKEYYLAFLHDANIIKDDLEL